jgi:hypothetical protein
MPIQSKRRRDFEKSFTALDKTAIHAYNSF